MPRDIAMVTPVPLTRELWQSACDAVQERYREPTAAEAPACSAVKVAPHGREMLVVSAHRVGVVLTVMASLKADQFEEVARLVPSAHSLTGQSLWWTEAWAPWGAVGDAGVVMAKALAHAVGGVVVAADPE
ncbi:MAG: hypothetical protein LBH68_06930 [Bifidobacteriaceae bacterium]|jgi:hypothetical protein|nr:hypothetical protein [Bifidobacteriaceae bacterium]